MDVISALLLTVFFVFSYLYFVRKSNNEKTKLINEFPGPKIYPIIGTPLPILWMKKYETFCYLRQLARQYGPVYRTWVGNVPSINITSPEYAELILNNSTHITKGYGYTFLAPWLGDGLLLSKGEKWHRHRKLLTPAFHFKILENFMNVFVDKSKLLVKRLDNNANGKPFNIFPSITRCALDIISETAMGIQVNAIIEEKSEYVSAIYGVCSAIVHRFARIWLHPDFIYNRTDRGKTYLRDLSVLHSTTNRVIQERKLILQRIQDNKNDVQDDFGGKKRKAFLDILLEVSNDSTGLTHEQIREEVDTFMFEGHDTTTASICWTIFLLGLHLDVQERAFEEVSQILCDDKSLEISDLSELKYLERIIKESLRLYPSVGAISRIAASDIKIGNYTIPAGISVGLHIVDIHRNDTYFPVPDRFDPDRFLPENTKNRHPYAYIPFSAGPRNCIGQKFALYEEKTVLAYIIKNYKIKSIQTKDNVHPVNDLIVRPDEGLMVTLEKRPTSSLYKK